MAEWKRPLFIGIGWGLGTVVGLVLLVGGFFWYQSRPKPPIPPKPWNTTAVKADYDEIDTEGEKNTYVFSYVLENTTDFDYRIEDGPDIFLSAKRPEKDGLVPFGEYGKIDFPIIVPARKRVRTRIHLDYSCPVKQKESADPAERRKYREAVERNLADTHPRLEGFDLLDQTNRYEIIFPAGWKH